MQMKNPAPRSGSACRKLGDLPGVSHEAKIEVWIREMEDGSSLIDLVECSWGAGIGWYTRKRVTLDANQVAVLQTLLGGEKGPDQAPRLRRPLPPVEREDNIIRLILPA